MFVSCGFSRVEGYGTKHFVMAKKILDLNSVPSYCPFSPPHHFASHFFRMFIGIAANSISSVYVGLRTNLEVIENIQKCYFCSTYL